MNRTATALLGALVGAGIGAVAGASLWSVVAAAIVGLDGMPDVNWGRYTGAVIGAIAVAVIAYRDDDTPKRPPLADGKRDGAD